jgi:hypothetical protein
MGRKYETLSETAEGFSEWIAPEMSGWRMSCCDCSLVHDFEFRVREGQVQLRAKRNARATGQRRRNRKDAKDENAPGNLQA